MKRCGACRYTHAGRNRSAWTDHIKKVAGGARLVTVRHRQEVVASEAVCFVHWCTRLKMGLRGRRGIETGRRMGSKP
jgi:hypothetical protein